MINRLLLLHCIASILIWMSSCKKDDATTAVVSTSCDFSLLTVSSDETYAFDTDVSSAFSQSSRWRSYDADITSVDGQMQLTADADNTSQALEAWKLFNTQMPYNKSWEISVDVHLPLYWNSNGGIDAQVGAGIFAGKPVASGESSKVYECNFAAVNGGARFVQAQLVANRLGGDPIDVQFTELDQSKENSTLKITFCSSEKKLSLFIDDMIVGISRRIDSKGLDNWSLSDSQLIDVGIMGFAENTVITSNPPTLDNFNYKIY